MTRSFARSAAAAAAALCCLSACTSDTAPVVTDPPAQFITQKRHWQPGERAALINNIVTNHLYSFPYAGDISDLAPQLYADTDSVTILVPNPAYVAPAGAAPQGLLASPGSVTGTQFSSTWNFVSAKITSVNDSATPPDTVFWHMVLWANPANKSDHGFVIAFSRASVFNISQINATTFDAGGGKAGAGAGEFHSSDSTLWEDIGSGGNYQSTNETFPGAFSTISTGPYLGGVSRAGTAFGRVFNSSFTRISGTELPTTYTVSFDFRGAGLPATEILCVFPSPCTTNVPIIQGAAWRVLRGRGTL